MSFTVCSAKGQWGVSRGSSAVGWCTSTSLKLPMWPGKSGSLIFVFQCLQLWYGMQRLSAGVDNHMHECHTMLGGRRPVGLSCVLCPVGLVVEQNQ